jgi:flagellar biosynthesis protein FlhA
MSMLSQIQKNGDVLVAVAVVSIVGVMILPVPPFILDLLLSFSISLSIVILVSAVYVRKPLDLSVFPTILLMTTLYRLSINIASTRLILLRGSEGVDAAGQVIKSFGSFVVGGNYAVGFIIFLILVVINFVVITKGSGRIAEVAARFVLDAMPGKQMAIDADLNAGIINDAEARRRRASGSLMTPAFRSASMAICLPGMASRMNRAATSAILPEPFVITTKLITTRIRKMMKPTA